MRRLTLCTLLLFGIGLADRVHAEVDLGERSAPVVRTERLACAGLLGPTIHALSSAPLPNAGPPPEPRITEFLQQDVACAGASLGDRVWFDHDEDGRQTRGEGGVSGATVTLFNSRNVPVAHQTTSADGGYLFDHLAPGTYFVVISNLPEGYRFTGRSGSWGTAVGSEVNAEGRSDLVTLAAGTHYRHLDAGIVPFGIYPTVEVQATCEGTYRATFGYFNEGASSVEVPVHVLGNTFAPLDGKQTTVFEPGLVPGAFAVDWDGVSPLTWWLRGPDGRTRGVTAEVQDAAPAAGCVCADPSLESIYAGGYILNAGG